MTRLKRWFGRAWGWPSLRWTERGATPVGQVCAHCGKPFVADDQGVELDDSGPIHRYCVYGFMFGGDAA